MFPYFQMSHFNGLKKQSQEPKSLPLQCVSVPTLSLTGRDLQTSDNKRFYSYQYMEGLDIQTRWLLFVSLIRGKWHKTQNEKCPECFFGDVLGCFLY